MIFNEKEIIGAKISSFYFKNIQFFIQKKEVFLENSRSWIFYFSQVPALIARHLSEINFNQKEKCGFIYRVGYVIGSRKKNYIKRPFLVFLIEDLNLSQKKLNGYSRTVETPRYLRFSRIGVPGKWPPGLSFRIYSYDPSF